MKYKTRYKIAAVCAALMLMCTACGEAAAAETQTDSTIVTETVSQTQTAAAADGSDLFTDRDLSGAYDESEAVSVKLTGDSAVISAESSRAGTAAAGVTVSGSTITITQEGTYVFTGTLDDGMIIVDADDSAKVQIVLNGASVTCGNSAALYVRSADKVFVTSAEGTENILANGGSFTAIDDSSIDAAVFAKDDITFNGSGTLTVDSPAGHGIAGKDDIKFAGGTIIVTAAEHGVQAHDSVRVTVADITITAGSKDGIHVSGSSEEVSSDGTGSFFYMADGSITISAGDDGIHADGTADITGGTITVTSSYEAIEALNINISGGTIDVTAFDDGLNAAGGSQTGNSTFGDDDWSGGGMFNNGGTNGTIVISGGDIHVMAGGDGLDSNGSIEITGGYTVVEGPAQGDTSVLDYNTTGTVSGGTFIGTGGAGMAETFSSAENQGVIAVSTGTQAAGTAVTLTDQSGSVIAETTPELDYAVVYISTPDMTGGSTYTLTAGSYSGTIELNGLRYSDLSGGYGGGRGNMPGKRGVMTGTPGEMEADHGRQNDQLYSTDTGV